MELTLCLEIRRTAGDMRRKFRYIITAFVLLWLTVSVVYLLPFLITPKEDPSFVSPAAALFLHFRYLASRISYFFIMCQSFPCGYPAFNSSCDYIHCFMSALALAYDSSTASAMVY